MDYAHRGSEPSEDVVGGAYEAGAADRQAGQSGWVADRSAGVGTGDRADGLGYFDGVGAEPAAAAGAVAQVLAFLDSCLPVGLGVAVDGSLGLVVGVSGETAASATIVNLGAGWLDVDASVSLGVGLPGLVGGEAGDTGAELGGGVGASTTAQRRFRIPWTQLCSAEVLAGLLGSIALQSSTVEAGLHVLGLVLPGRDLNPFLIEESYALEGTAQLEASLGALGEEVSWLLQDTVGATVGVAWDDLPDDRGHREGTLSLEGTGEMLHQVALNLEHTAGVDVEVPLPDASVTGALVVPITEDLGVITFGTPWLRLSASCAVGPGAGEVGVEVGPDHAVVDAEVSLTVQHPTARGLVDDLSERVPLLTAGMADIDGPSSTVSVGLSVAVGPALLAEGGATAQDVAQYLFTGQVSPALAAVRGLLDAAVAAAEVTVGVDLTLLSASFDGEVEGGAGVVLGGSLGAEESLVYRNDDVAGLLAACPTAADVVALLRSGASVA